MKTAKTNLYYGGEYQKLTEAVLRQKQRDKMDKKEFAFTSRTGEKKLPINDANHVKAAMGRLNSTHGIPADQKPSVAAKISRKAKSLV